MTVRDAFAMQGPICASMGSPFMGRLMPLIGERLTHGSAVADRVLTWQGDPSPRGDSVPLRLAGALHALKIDGIALTDVYPPAEVGDDLLWDAIDDALITFEARIQHWLDSPPQTNEVRRASVIMAALAEVETIFGQPVELLELGTSGGLNLRCDQFRLDLNHGGLGPLDATVRLSPDWTGPQPKGALPSVIARKGVDLNPLDPKWPEDRLRLLAFIWPDQADRVERTLAAIQLAARVPAEIAKDDAAAWMERVLADPAPDRVRVVFHTIAWQYFPEDTRQRLRTAMAATRSPLVEIGMEGDGGDGAAVTLTHWPEGRSTLLGRVSFHGLWVKWFGT
jgi:hypothetical protein